MIRNLDREEMELSHPSIEKCRIGILGCSRGAGASFLTLTLAKAISGYGLIPAVVEVECSGIYDAIGIEARFAGRDFFSHHRALYEERKIRGRDNFDEGINWVLKCPDDEHIRLGESKKLRLIENVAGEVMLCDFSGLELEAHSDSMMKEILRNLDGLIAVVDPLPSKLLGSYPLFLEIGRLSKDVLYVVNKNNRGINRQELMRLLEVANPVTVPFIAPEHIYESEYNCRLAYGCQQVRRQLEEPMRLIMKRMIPSDLLKF